jgi:pilus assembly protein CpaC
MTPIALTWSLALAASADPIRVAPGAHRTLNEPGLTRVAIGKEEICDVKVVNDHELLLVGRQKGRTTLTIWSRGQKNSITRDVIVDDTRADELARLVRDLVNSSLRVETFNEKVVVEGTLDSLTELDRLKTLVSDDPNVKLLVQLNPSLMPVVASEITKALHKQGLVYAQAVAIGGRIVLEGSVADNDEYKKAQLIADSYYSVLHR